MFSGRTNLEQKIKVRVATSAKMDTAIEKWARMYVNEADWLTNGMKSLGLPSAIAEEFARLVLTEFSFELDGSERANLISEWLENTIGNLDNIIEQWGALGGVMLKPYVCGRNEEGNPDKISVDVVLANKFYLTSFNDDKEITGAIFLDTVKKGDYLYTRVEHHELEKKHYVIENRAFRSERLNASDDGLAKASYPFQDEISLEDVEEWSGISPVVEMTGIEKPFFVYIKTPRANNVDVDSPLGSSVYSRAEMSIEEADKQFERCLWEFEAKETAIDTDVEFFKNDGHGNPVLPIGRERLYRTYEADSSEVGKAFFNIFSPDIRDDSMFRGLNEILRKVEFQCGLAYGTFSNVNDIEKTATEINASKQRSYTTVSKMQDAWDKGLQKLLDVMDSLCTLYKLCPPGALEKTCTWGDGILEDNELEVQRRLSLFHDNLYGEVEFRMWYFGESEEQAQAALDAIEKRKAQKMESYLPSFEEDEEKFQEARKAKEKTKKDEKLKEDDE